MGSRRSWPNSHHARDACSERKRCCDGVGASQPVADSWTSAIWAISLDNGDGRNGRASHTWVGSGAKCRSSLASLNCVCCFLFRREGGLVVLHDWAGVDALESADLQLVSCLLERDAHASVEPRPQDRCDHAADTVAGCADSIRSQEWIDIGANHDRSNARHMRGSPGSAS
jgi:hypothetical protein